MAGQYLYFWYDTSSDSALDYVGGEGSRNDWTGRIHGVQLEFAGLNLDPARNEIPIVWVAFFRSVEEAEVYIENYLEELGWVNDEIVTEETDEETDEASESEESLGNETEDDVEDHQTKETLHEESTEEDQGVNETESKASEGKTEEKSEDNGGADAGKSGCGSTVGFGAIAIVAILGGAWLVTEKEKIDNE